MQCGSASDCVCSGVLPVLLAGITPDSWLALLCCCPSAEHKVHAAISHSNCDWDFFFLKVINSSMQKCPQTWVYCCFCWPTHTITFTCTQISEHYHTHKQMHIIIKMPFMSSVSAPLSTRSLIHMQPRKGWCAAFVCSERARQGGYGCSLWELAHFCRWSQPEVSSFMG